MTDATPLEHPVGMWNFPCQDNACVPAKSRPYARDRNYPSATTLSSLLDKPGLAWAASKEATIYCLNHAAELAAMDYEAAVDKGRRHFRVLWDNAANLGTLTHSASEAFARGVDFDPPADMADDDYVQLGNFVGGLTRWFEQEQPQVLATELIVRHDDPNVIGSLDMLAIVHGRPVIIDWKNTRKLDADPYAADWGRQLGTYMACDTLCHYHDGKLAATMPWAESGLPRPKAALIVNIMGDGRVRQYEFERDDDVALGQIAALVTVKSYKPKFSVGAEIAVPAKYPPRPDAPVSPEAFLD